MNSTFEDQLRGDLREAAGRPAYDGLDPAQVIGEGTRLVRRRRIVRGATAAAAVAIIAVGGALAAGNGRPESTPMPPADRSASASASVVSATLRKGDANLNGEVVPGPSTFAVDLDPATGHVQYFSVGDDGKRMALGGSSDTSDLPHGATWGTGTGAENAWVGIVPRGATNLMPAGPVQAAGGGSVQDQAPLPGTQYEAFAVWFQKAADMEGLTTMLWLAPSGRVQAANGSPVGSVSFEGEDGKPVTVFVSEEVDTLGAITDTGAARVALSAKAGSVPHLQAGNGTATRMLATVVALLPQGATDPIPEFSDGVGAPTLQAKEVPETPYTAVFATFTVRGSATAAQPWMTSIRWTGADGEARSASLR